MCSMDIAYYRMGWTYLWVLNLSLVGPVKLGPTQWCLTDIYLLLRLKLGNCSTSSGLRINKIRNVSSRRRGFGRVYILSKTFWIANKTTLAQEWALTQVATTWQNFENLHKDLIVSQNLVRLYTPCIMVWTEKICPHFKVHVCRHFLIATHKIQL